MWVNVLLPPSVSVAEASRLCGRIRQIIRGFPEVTQVISQTGRPEDGTDPKTINMAEFFVDLKPASEWPRKIEREELAAQIEAAVDRVPGLDPAMSQPISRQRAREHLPDRRHRDQVFGDDPARCRSRVPHVRSGIRGVARSSIARLPAVPHLVQGSVDRRGGGLQCRRRGGVIDRPPRREGRDGNLGGGAGSGARFAPRA
jgi:cobalt-zinc-cadmium resistance protein CzcA